MIDQLHPHKNKRTDLYIMFLPKNGWVVTALLIVIAHTASGLLAAPPRAGSNIIDQRMWSKAHNNPAVPSLGIMSYPLLNTPRRAKSNNVAQRSFNLLCGGTDGLKLKEINDPPSQTFRQNKRQLEVEKVKGGIQRAITALARFIMVAGFVVALTLLPANAKGGGGKSSYRSSGGSYSSKPSMSRSTGSNRSSPRPSPRPAPRPSSSSPRPAPRPAPSFSSSSPRPAPTPIRSSASSSSPSPAPVPAKRRSTRKGRAGGRARRGARTKRKEEVAPRSQEPVHIQDSPRSNAAPSLPAPARRYRPRPSSPSRQWGWYQPRRELVIVQEQPPSTQQVIQGIPQPSSLTPEPVHTAVVNTNGNLVPQGSPHNPWPDRILGASVGAGVGAVATGVYFETQFESRLANEIRKRNLAKRKTSLSNLVRRKLSSSLSSVESSQKETPPSNLNRFDPARDSGTYRGKTMESDGTSQVVKSKLQFLENGKVQGDGFDDEDGPYTIDGNWSDLRASWKETYGNYWVEVQCTRKPGKDSYLTCTFKSSMDKITGKFYLEKKSKS